MKKLIILFLSILIVSSCTVVRKPTDYPLIITEISQSSESDYAIYVVKDSNPNIQGWMYIGFKDKRNKFNIGDTIVFSKK